MKFCIFQLLLQSTHFLQSLIRTEKNLIKTTFCESVSKARLFMKEILISTAQFRTFKTGFQITKLIFLLKQFIISLKILFSVYHKRRYCKTQHVMLLWETATSSDLWTFLFIFICFSKKLKDDRKSCCGCFKAMVGCGLLLLSLCSHCCR